MVHKHVITHLQTNELLSPAQYGFRPGLGTGDAIFDFLDHTYREMDKGKLISTCFVDGSKAFDSVHHALLLRKCAALKIDNKVLKWLKSYLSNRRQVTTLNGVKSRECKVNFGVPQGSSLGPLMFLMFINDFPRHINNSKVFMYADDIVLISSGDTYVESERLLREDVEVTNEWCNRNCLTVNKKKTKVMRITRNRIGGIIPPLNISIGENKLEDVSEYRYLGIAIDHRFTFKPQVNSIIRSISHKIYMLGRIRKYMDEEQCVLVYKTMIVPYFDYANFAIECTTDDLVGKLQKLQNRALRVCRFSNMYERSSATDLHTHFELKTLDHRRDSQLLLMMFKKSKSNGHLIPLVERRTRGDHKIKFENPRNTYASSDKNPWHRGVKAWDLLTADTQKLEKSAAFKHAIKLIIPPPKS